MQEHIYETQEELTHREWFIKRPHNYLGSVQKVVQERYILENEQILKKEVNIVPGLIKVFCEAVDNSVDQYVKTEGRFGNKISVEVTKDYIEVSDNGPGIKNKLNQNNEYPLYVAMCKFMSGSNYKESESSAKGTNGVGIKSTTTSSTEAIITNTDDVCTMELIVNENNLNHEIKKIKKKSTTGITIKFKPDFNKIFEGEYIDDLHISIMKQYIIMQSLTYPDITFKFNGDIIKLDEKKFLNLVSSNFYLYKSDNYFFAITPNDTDEFKQLSYVNGLELIKGGTHINVIINNIVGGLREKLVKKYKTIKPADIKNRLQLVMIARNFINMKQDGQTKEMLTNTEADVKKYLGDIDFDKIVNGINKISDIMEPITEIYKIKEEFKLRQELKNSEKPVKKLKDEKFVSPIGEWNRIFLAEGDSASASISKIIGRQGNGFYAMFGVPPNSYDMEMKDILASNKMKALQTLLGLKFSQTTQDNINFNEIIIATDADLPGFFIRGQLLGLFARFGKNLFDEKRIKIFRTPVIVGYNSKEDISVWFYDAEELQEYERKHEKNKLTFEWKKGLASWDQKELQYIIEKEGLENMLETMVYDENAQESLNNWLNNELTDKRKEMLDGFEFSVVNL